MKFLVSINSKVSKLLEFPTKEVAEVTLGAQYPDSKINIKNVITLDNGCDVVVPNYLSPTSIDKAYNDHEEFFNNYVTTQQQPRLPQTYQMMFGSAFDAFAKSFLVEKVLGKVPKEFQLDNIVKSQCEEQFWNKGTANYKEEHDAYYWGEYLFNAYKTSGALSDLLIELQEAASVNFEFTVTNEVRVRQHESGVILLGKPDVYFKTKAGNQVIVDWKCNGIYSKNPTSPKPQYMRSRDGWVGNQSRSHMTRHKDVLPLLHKGMTINGASSFETIDATWAAQLATYGWLMGEPVGSDFIVGIDQLTGAPNKPKEPLIRVSSHRAIISAKWQEEFFIKAKELWDKLQVGHVFVGMSKEESDNLVAEMYAVHGTYEPGSKEEWLAKSMRVSRYGHNK